MENFIKRLSICLLTVSLAGIMLSPVNAQGPQDLPRKIVVFQEYFVNEAAQIAILKNFGATIAKPLGLINGMVVYLPPQAERALGRVSEILRIDDDLIIEAIGKPLPPPQPAEVLPWGIDRINADVSWPTTKGLTVKVAILDTGIDLDHLDLKDNIKGNVNTINPLKSGNDDNGHGTHVAGIVAAVDNDIGVIGAGPQIYLYAVKVLGKNGSGWLSDLIEGLDWCINNNMQVVNMSLGSSSDNQSFHDAIIRVYQAGIIQVAAAGNNGASGGAISYPAKYPEAIAISAIDQSNQFASSFSSYGPEIDLAAPGVNINSTYNNGYYKVLNGTSMACPHVTGTVALVISTKGQMTPDQMNTHLKSTSENLGLPSSQQGAGLVRADLAIQ